MNKTFKNEITAKLNELGLSVEDWNGTLSAFASSGDGVNILKAIMIGYELGQAERDVEMFEDDMAIEIRL